MKSRDFGPTLRRRVSWRTLLIGPKLANMMPRDQDKKLRNRFSRRALLIVTSDSMETWPVSGGSSRPRIHTRGARS